MFLSQLLTYNYQRLGNIHELTLLRFSIAEWEVFMKWLYIIWIVVSLWASYPLTSCMHTSWVHVWQGDSVSCFPSSSSPPSSRGIDQDSTSTDSGAARNNLSPSQMEASLMTDDSAIVGETLAGGEPSAVPNQYSEHTDCNLHSWCMGITSLHKQFPFLETGTMSPHV